MAAEDDILLREIDDELKQDQAVEFFKKNGPWIGGLAAIVIAGVAGMQVHRGAQDRAAVTNAEIFTAAVSASAEDQTTAATEMLQAADQTDGGYAGLARLRAAAFLVQDGDIDGANAALITIAQDEGLPDRLRDLARLRTASLVLDDDPARATALAGEVATEAMQPFADEIKALAALSAGDFEAAYTGFTQLVEQGSALAIPAVAERARLMAPVADAARRGVSLEPQESEADAFIRSFTDQLDQELSTPVVEDGLEDAAPEEDASGGDDTN